jgi:hypothetical protein
MNARPPAVADWLLRVLLPRGRETDVIRGDLIEEFRRRAAAAGRPSASAWFYREALSSIFQGHRYRHMVTLDHLRQDVRYASRAARRTPGFTALVVVTLALGIGASTSIFSIVNGILLRPLPLRDPDRLLWVNEATRRGETISVSWMNYLDWRARARSFDGLAASRPATFNLTSAGQARRLTGRTVTSNFFAVVGMQPALGRAFTDADERGGAPGVAVISHELWQRQLNADADVLGRTLMLTGQAYTVVGVLPAGFRYLRPYDLFVNMGPIAGAQWATERENHQGFVVVGRLRDGVMGDAASSELREIENDIVRLYPASASGLSIVTEPLAARLVKTIRGTPFARSGRRHAAADRVPNVAGLSSPVVPRQPARRPGCAGRRTPAARHAAARREHAALGGGRSARRLARVRTPARARRRGA